MISRQHTKLSIKIKITIVNNYTAIINLHMVITTNDNNKLIKYQSYIIN